MADENPTRDAVHASRSSARRLAEVFQRAATLAVIIVVTALAFRAGAGHLSGPKWIGTSGSWDDGTNWDVGTQPQAGDYVQISFADSLDRTITYVNSLNPTEDLSRLWINSAGSGLVTFRQAQDELNVHFEDIGFSDSAPNNNQARFVQSGGTHNISFLNIADGSIGPGDVLGTYELSGGALNVRGTRIGEGYGGPGQFVSGSFVHSGGTHTAIEDVTVGDTNANIGPMI